MKKNSTINTVQGDHFDRLIFAKSMMWGDEFANIKLDNIVCSGSDHRYTKFIAYENNNGEEEQAIQIFVDRANGYKPIFFYGHDGWIC